MNTFTETLQTWQNFYFMIGGVVAALLGLMFVALSLGMHLVSDETREEFEIFVTPSVVYFVSALLVACVMLMPAMTPVGLAVVLFLGGGLGFTRGAKYARLLSQAARRHQDFELVDWLSNVIMPVGGYALILVAALCFAITQWSLAFFAIWLATIFLLLSAITNTWNLVIWILEQRKE
jgi:hypothetical protein